MREKETNLFGKAKGETVHSKYKNFLGEDKLRNLQDHQYYYKYECYPEGDPGEIKETAAKIRKEYYEGLTYEERLSDDWVYLLKDNLTIEKHYREKIIRVSKDRFSDYQNIIKNVSNPYHYIY